MPLNADVLAGLMRTKMDALSDAEKADRSNTLKALAEAVIEHITMAGVVVGTAAAVTPGAGTAVVTGTLT